MSRFYFVITILTLASCRKDTETPEPYFKFDSIGEQLLSGVKLNGTLKFKGSNGSYREFRVFEIQKSKQTVQECSWNFGTCKIYYHFDNLKFYFLRTDSTTLPPNSPLTYSLTLQMQLPLDVDKNNIPKDVQAKATVHGNAFIDYNAIPPQGSFSPYIVFPDFYTPQTLTSYSNPVRTYIDVIVIKSGNNSVYKDYFGNNYTVNEVWFDKRYGFVFFKDIFGNSWSRTN